MKQHEQFDGTGTDRSGRGVFIHLSVAKRFPKMVTIETKINITYEAEAAHRPRLFAQAPLFMD